MIIHRGFKFFTAAIFFVFCASIFSGCATYRFLESKKPDETGFVVSRDDYTMPEYTSGSDNKPPEELNLAKKRFSRRRRIVEDYYKRMGYIENHFKMVFWNPCIYTLKTIKGVFKLPFVAISDYRFDHNPTYREKVLEREAESDAREEARIQELKDKLHGYIEQDTSTEVRSVRPAAPQPTAEVVDKTLARIEKEISSVKKSRSIAETSLRASDSSLSESQPVAIIRAKPDKGFSPLRVKFYGYKSYEKGEKIASYHWDFGDGETSSKINPVNIYYSGSSTPKYFNVTLTVKDARDNVAQANTVIEVLNK